MILFIHSCFTDLLLMKLSSSKLFFLLFLVSITYIDVPACWHHVESLSADGTLALFSCCSRIPAPICWHELHLVGHSATNWCLGRLSCSWAPARYLSFQHYENTVTTCSHMPTALSTLLPFPSATIKKTYKIL